MNLYTTMRRRMRAALFCVALALACACVALVESRAGMAASTVAPVEVAGSLSEKDRIEVFEKVWKEIDEKYFDANFNGVDWRAAHERYRPLAAAAKSDEEFYALLKRMLGELRDAHTVFFTPRAVEARKRGQATSAGITLSEVEGRLVVFIVEPDSDAARAGVEPGMIVRTFDGVPATERLAAVSKEVSASSSDRLTRLRIYAGLLAGAANTPLQLGLERADKTTFEATLTRRSVSKVSNPTAYLLPSGYAYLRFDSFREGIAKELKPLIEKFADAPALVIDLRLNGGGEVPDMLKVAGYFFDEKVFMARGVNRTGKPVSFLGGFVKIPLEAYAGEPGGRIFAKPVVILIGERTASSAENFTQGLKENGRATVVGSQTCGCVNVFNDRIGVKGGGDFQLSELGYVSAKGVRLESVGVTPDINVALTLADLRSHRDAWLEAAVKFLNSHAGK